MPKPKVAISSCLMGNACRYDGDHNLNEALLAKLADYEVIHFCPEDYCFGTPRPTMDLIDDGKSINAISNETDKNLSSYIIHYAEDFFKEHPEVELFIGKDRSPSCAVCSGKVYNKDKKLLHTNGAGLMAKVALGLGIKAYDAEVYCVHS